ncbi:MAG TPA: hypothetical protein ENH62_06330 [Marinobacter sp.]|uniref:Uncharacterized protein n=1 Tax=marine sediment metagenome TaxID=412755 RepID=A0A0F9NV66_9ZZZZ|nr:hypothetical protein [Marinobacter sp.]
MTYNPHIPVTDGLVLGLVFAGRTLLDYSGAGRHPSQAVAGMEWISINGVMQLRATGAGGRG